MPGTRRSRLRVCAVAVGVGVRAPARLAILPQGGNTAHPHGRISDHDRARKLHVCTPVR